MTSTDLQFARNETFDVEPHEVESALAELWRQMAGEDGEASVVQVRTLNLLIFVPEAHATPEIMRAVQAVSLRHPGRTITMIATDGDEAPRANVTIACRVGSDGKQACGEQITITAGDGGAALPSIAAALLIAGVPDFLWWIGDPRWNSPVFDALTEIADRVIVDGRTWRHPLADLPRLVAATATPIAYTDLLWTALTPWRRFTAQCFDMPDARAQLDRLDRVFVSHGPADADRLAALLLAGWLSSRLGWTIAQAAPLQLQAGSRSVAIEFQAQAGGSGVQRMVLGSPDAEVTLQTLSGSTCVQSTIRLPQIAPIERVAAMGRQTLDQLVSQELDMLDRDRGFEAAITIAAQLAAISGPI